MENQDMSSKELLKVEANMSNVPAILQMNNNKKSPCTKGSTFKPPPSSILERVRNFIPVISKANADMTDQMSRLAPGSFDIEQVDDCEQVIEMNIALVERDGSDSDTDSYTDSSDSDLDLSDSEEHSNPDKDQINMESLFGELTPENLKLKAKISSTKSGKQKPNIEVLDSLPVVDSSSTSVKTGETPS